MIKRNILLFYFIIFVASHAFCCTSAIIGADMNPYGRPLLWKNRDTSASDNKIEYIKGTNGDFSYVALYNAQDTCLNEAWMGMNDHGFAIMNTASYNLKNDNIPSSEMDKEGLVMSQALKNCVTVNDFANLLDTLPKPLGVEANFGVIDAYGNGAYFETDNFKYTVFNLADSPDHILVRTNYSQSGRPDEGYGFIREGNANHLLQPYIASKNISPEILTEVLSRSFYHDLLGKDFSSGEGKWVIDQDFIPRYTSVATVVIEGCVPKNEREIINPENIITDYVMWTGLGYPPCSEIYPVICTEEGVAEELRGSGINGTSPQCDLVNKRKNIVFPLKAGNGSKYIDMSKLFNENGTGYVQTLVPKNLETYKKFRSKRDN